MTPRRNRSIRRHVRGAAAVEFAVTSLFWIAMMIAVIDFGRLMYLWTASYEATRIGARYAVVCSVSWADAKARMRAALPIVQDTNIQVQYPSGPCTNAGGCPPTTVTIEGVTFNSMIPLVPLTFSLPTAKTSMTPETRRSDTDPVCN